MPQYTTFRRPNGASRAPSGLISSKMLNPDNNHLKERMLKYPRPNITDNWRVILKTARYIVNQHAYTKDDGLTPIPFAKQTSKRRGDMARRLTYDPRFPALKDFEDWWAADAILSSVCEYAGQNASRGNGSSRGSGWRGRSRKTTTTTTTSGEYEDGANEEDECEDGSVEAVDGGGDDDVEHGPDEASEASYDMSATPAPPAAANTTATQPKVAAKTVVKAKAPAALSKKASSASNKASTTSLEPPTKAAKPAKPPTRPMKAPAEPPARQRMSTKSAEPTALPKKIVNPRVGRTKLAKGVAKAFKPPSPVRPSRNRVASQKIIANVLINEEVGKAKDNKKRKHIDRQERETTTAAAKRRFDERRAAEEEASSSSESNAENDDDEDEDVKEDANDFDVEVSDVESEDWQ